MSGLRLCRDCRWQRRPVSWLFMAICANHDVAPVELDLVSGRTRQKERSCETGRGYGACGPEGNQWSPR
jgi:hypothetical protein